MNAQQLMMKLGEHLVMHVAPKMSNPLNKFKIGVLAGGIGQRRVLEMASPYLKEVTGTDGEIDIAALRQAVNAGFSVAKAIPIGELGITINQTDADAFFETL